EPLDRNRQQRPPRSQQVGQQRAAAGNQHGGAIAWAPPVAPAFHHELVGVEQPAGVERVQRERARHQQQFAGRDHCRSFFLNSDLSQTPSPTRPASRSFQLAARNAAIAPKKPFLPATATAPPVISAASPYSATRSPAT